MKSPEPESAPARAAAKAEEGAGTRDPAPPCRLPLGPVTWQAPASSTHVRGAAWVGMRLKTAQDTTTGHPGLDVSGRTRVGHEVGKRLSPARASATCDHGAPHPLHGPWTSFKWVQSRSPPSATKGISSSDPQQFSHPWVIPAAFCTKPSRAVLWVQGSAHLPGRPLPYPAAPGPDCSPISLWVGSLPLGESPGSLGITLHPAASHRLPSGPRGSPMLGFPSRASRPLPCSRQLEAALRARPCRTHAELTPDLPEKGVDTVGGWGGLGLGPYGLPGWHERP